VLDANEDVAFAYCRSTDNLVAVRLTPDGARRLRRETEYVEQATWKERLSPWGPFAYAKLEVEPLREDLALGRRLFYDALEPVVSGVAACSGCHPEGRDDGHVWREVPAGRFTRARFAAGPSVTPESDAGEEEERRWGYARQTPMLAGRVDAPGPYGWHGESPTLVDRIKAGFALHRSWPHDTDGKTLRDRAEPLAAFLREGLVPPPRATRALSDEEERGRAIFESKQAQCALCHVPATGFTDRSVVPLRGFKAKPMFQEDPNPAYKVPSLRFVGGTAPYYHDASMPTLEALVNDNLDRMGKTSHLDAQGRAALIAFLRTL
jgi:cytochrome c peroxidase